jgi:hypothetical protein
VREREEKRKQRPWGLRRVYTVAPLELYEMIGGSLGNSIKLDLLNK